MSGVVKFWQRLKKSSAGLLRAGEYYTEGGFAPRRAITPLGMAGWCVCQSAKDFQQAFWNLKRSLRWLLGWLKALASLVWAGVVRRGVAVFQSKRV